MATQPAFNKSLGTRLRSARILAGYSYADIAIMTGISRGKLGDYERGEICPGVVSLVKILLALNADANSILGLPDKSI